MAEFPATPRSPQAAGGALARPIPAPRQSDFPETRADPLFPDRLDSAASSSGRARDLRLAATVVVSITSSNVAILPSCMYGAVSATLRSVGVLKAP